MNLFTRENSTYTEFSVGHKIYRDAIFSYIHIMSSVFINFCTKRIFINTSNHTYHRTIQKKLQKSWKLAKTLCFMLLYHRKLRRGMHSIVFRWQSTGDGCLPLSTYTQVPTDSVLYNYATYGNRAATLYDILI